MTVPGNLFNLWWAIPFCGILLSLAIAPLAIPHTWERHHGKIVLLWATALTIALVMNIPLNDALGVLLYTFFHHYIPFILLLLALFTLSGGIHLKVRFRGTPIKNTILLGGGTLLASFIGTTGALVLLIRPLLMANQGRVHRQHLVVFLIILVGNVGGVLSPLGDPPLFMGYLMGVSFFWPLIHLWPLFLCVFLPVLIFFFLYDFYLLKNETSAHHPKVREKLTFETLGKINFTLLFFLVGGILALSQWKNSPSFSLGYVHFSLSDLFRDILMILTTTISLWKTPISVRHLNKFSWSPMREVSLVFLSIFITVIPLMAMLEDQEKGAFGPIVELLQTQNNQNISLYFWLTGFFSAFLDNAPTYLVFFKVSGGNPDFLMHSGSQILKAISAGAVFMGALTYIGNAPNFMAKSIAEEYHVRMPSFFHYILLSSLILFPLFFLIVFFFF